MLLVVVDQLGREMWNDVLFLFYQVERPKSHNGYQVCSVYQFVKYLPSIALYDLHPEVGEMGPYIFLISPVSSGSLLISVLLSCG